jgi:hypothetical protein
MAGETQDKIWPLPKFSFSVTIDGAVTSFQEVSGLDVEAQVIEYRAGDSKGFSTIKMPGIQKSGNVTLKKGVFATDNAWPTKITGTDLKADGNEVAVETIEVAHEGLTIANA